MEEQYIQERHRREVTQIFEGTERHDYGMADGGSMRDVRGGEAIIDDWRDGQITKQADAISDNTIEVEVTT
jgi:hypothetical protein